jgi:tetratricopeptide (TPR) repeat protein
MGSLAETPLPALLVGLHRDAFSGRLVLRRAALSKSFEWRRGLPVGVDSPLAAEKLGQILVEQRALDAGARARLEQLIVARGCSELQALAGLRGVSPRAVVLALAEQLRRALRDCLGWRDGAFELEPGEAGSAPALPFDLLALVAEEVARGWAAHDVLVALGPHALSFPTLVPGFRAPWLGEGETPQRLLARLDGSAPSYALLNELADPLAAAGFWILDVLGALVHRAQPAEPPREGEATPGPDIEIVLRDAPSTPGTAAKPEARAAASPAAVAADAASETLRRELCDLHRRLASLSLWEVLGVPRNADAREVRRAYLRAAKRLHPDRLAQLGLSDLKAQANEVFAQIARAHEVLSDPERRRLYEETLGDPTVADADRIAEAEAAFRRGDVLLRAGNFRGALELLERAVTLWPEEAEYQAAFAWALHRKTPPESERAWQHFERALALGEQAVWLLRASLVARELGHEARAAELASRARALDPNAKA